MARLFYSPLIILALIPGACVPEEGAISAAAPTEASCAERRAVARQLAGLHQYGGDPGAYIGDLARQGASPKDLADYRLMARQISAVPTLAGDGGRERGVELSLAAVDLRCKP